MPKTKLDRLRDDVQTYSEVHAVLADDPLVDDDEPFRDIREHQATFYDDAGLVEIEAEDAPYTVDVDHIVYWWPPQDF